MEKSREGSWEGVEEGKGMREWRRERGESRGGKGDEGVGKRKGREWRRERR